MNRTLLGVVGVLMVALFASANLPWQLDDYDQAKQAYTSFEMVKAGHWLYQHTPHERVATKPPLVGWISAILYEITRSWDLAWRLPSLGAAIGLAILLFRAGNIYGATGGLIAMSAFAFNLLTPRLASLVRTDMPLALMISLIGLLIWRKIREGQGWERRDRILLFVLLTAAMLIKGPIVYAFLLPGMIALMAVYRRTQRNGRPGCGWWPWIGSLGIFLVWGIAGSLSVPNFYEQVVQREFLGRFGQTVHRPQPFYFYWPHLLHKFGPWSVLMIVFAMIDLRASRWKLREMKIAPETVWLLGWALGGLVVMSIIPSKRVDRIFPVIPPLCLLLAVQLQNRGELVRRWGAAILVVAVLFSGGYAAYKVSSGYRMQRDGLVRFGQRALNEIRANHWRYEVVDASDEGLLLYLDKLHFVKTVPGLTDFADGKLDALIVPKGLRPPEFPVLPDGAFSPHDFSERYEGQNYVLIVRSR